MGSRGPIPKREAERMGHSKPETPLDKVDAVGPVSIPKAPSTWHPVAKRIYESLQPSGEAQFYEPSDWSTAYMLAESLSRDLNPQFVGLAEKKSVTKDGTLTTETKPVMQRLPLKGASLAAYLKGFAALGVTEGDRRRMGIEIDRDKGPQRTPDLAILEDYRAKIQGT